MDFGTSIAGLELESPVLIAAGMVKTIEQVRKVAASASAAVTVGSITVEPRDGNDGNVYHFDSAGKFSLNSLGLPNAGIQCYQQWLPDMVDIVHSCGKLLIVSVAGFTAHEYGFLAYSAFMGGADIVELNLGCPNVWHGSEQHRIASFDPEMVEEILRIVGSQVGDDRLEIGVKLSPYSDPQLLREVATVLASSSLVKVVTTCNTFPNALEIDDRGEPYISTGLAGLAGPALFPIMLGQVEQFRALLPKRIDIIATGGIWTGQDVRKALSVGANACGIASLYMERRERVFSDLLIGLIDEEFPTGGGNQ